MERKHNTRHLLRRFVRELQTEICNTSVTPICQVQARLLRFGAEHRVAASDVGQHRMRSSGGVLQRHYVLLARPSAITIVGAGREETAEHAMLSMKHGQMLVDNCLDTVRAQFA